LCDMVQQAPALIRRARSVEFFNTRPDAVLSLQFYPLR
jgi:hypothetical protein